MGHLRTEVRLRIAVYPDEWPMPIDKIKTEILKEESNDDRDMLVFDYEEV